MMISALMLALGLLPRGPARAATIDDNSVAAFSSSLTVTGMIAVSNSQIYTSSNSYPMGYVVGPGPVNSGMKGRFGTYGDTAFLSDNLFYDGSNWTGDTVANAGAMWLMQSGVAYFLTRTAGTTAPSTGSLNNRLIIDNSGNMYTTNWTNVTFGTGWSNYAGGYQSVQYMKVGDHVFLRGLANSGTNSWGTDNIITTLPAGLRPLARLIFNQQCNANVACRVDIDTSGNVTFMANGAGSGWIALDGINFSTQ